MALFGTQYTYVYTSIEEIDRLFSEVGRAYASDDQPDNEDVLNEVIQRATGRVNQYLSKVFDPINLYQSQRIREIATIIACYLLSIRRGNPSLYSEQYLEALADLEAIVSGELYLSELPRTANAPVTMQNVSSDNRYPFTPIRVDPLSASKLTGKEYISRLMPFSWL